MTEELRMDAYYYEFEPTGVYEIDVILSAVATAGKAFHHTEDWMEVMKPPRPFSGVTPVQWIQNAAKEAVAALQAERERGKWRPIDSAPSDQEFLAYGSYLYPGDTAVTEYIMIAEVSFGDAEFPYRTHEGTHRKGFFSHWKPLPEAPK